MFYPMALTIYTTRIIISLGSFALCAGVLKIIMLGHRRNTPVTGIRQWLNKTYYQFMMGLIIKCSFMSLKTEFVDCDYSHFLGPDYLAT